MQSNSTDVHQSSIIFTSFALFLIDKITGAPDFLRNHSCGVHVEVQNYCRRRPQQE